MTLKTPPGGLAGQSRAERQSAMEPRQSAGLGSREGQQCECEDNEPDDDDGLLDGDDEFWWFSDWMKGR